MTRCWPSGVLHGIEQAWARFMHLAMNSAAPWLRIEHHHVEDAVRAVDRQVLQGHSDPRMGHMLAL